MTNWARELGRGLVDLSQLKAQNLLDAPVESTESFERVKENFDIRVPAQFVEAIKNGNSDLAAQFIPTLDELDFSPQELEDPIGDDAHSPMPGLVHRYPDRVLIKPTFHCASYCRFCFRRYKVSTSEFKLEGESLQNVLSYIKSKPQVWEVILSGGDPLAMTDARLTPLLSGLADIRHLEILRLHTRVPSVLPSRINQALVDLLKKTGKQVWLVVHINTASELTPESLEAIGLLQRNGITVLSQTVLLKEVNGTPEKLEQLFRALVRAGVKPYYLHYPDLARGTQHFRVPLDEAVAMVDGLRGKLSGLCLPQLVIDIPGGAGKIAVSSENLRKKPDSSFEMRSPLTGDWQKVEYPLQTNETQPH